jgi:hypothetical protein
MLFLICAMALQGAPESLLWTEEEEGYEIIVSYPEAALKNAFLGDILEAYALSGTEAFRELYQDYWTNAPSVTGGWFMELNFTHEPSPDGMISVIAWMWDFTGGAHGNSYTRAFNYSTGENRLVDVVELLGGEERFNSFAMAVVEYLQSQGCYDDEWVARGAGPDPGNYHTVIPVPGEDGGYTVFFPPYQVDCYATGTVEVFVPGDWERLPLQEVR